MKPEFERADPAALARCYMGIQRWWPSREQRARKRRRSGNGNAELKGCHVYKSQKERVAKAKEADALGLRYAIACVALAGGTPA